jgi:hypothetical protein
MSDVCEHAPAWLAEMVMPTASISPGREPDPLEIDPRPCELCGRTIDQHKMVDHGEGPEFFCYADDDIVTLWELADPRDAWCHTGETPPPAGVRNSDITAQPSAPKHYRTPAATVAAFLFVASLDDPEHLARWLDQHPRDEKFLCKLWKSKNAAEA